MIDSLVDRATSILERRFLTNAFLPVLLFLPAVLMPSLLQGNRIGDWTVSWGALPVGTKALMVVGYFTFTWFLAVILASQWRNIIRLYEGYPLIHIPFLDEMGKYWHGNQLATLDRGGSGSEHLEYRAFPQRPEILPTRLGNVLRAAEMYPYYRYEADLILLWPRLREVVPADSMTEVDGARARMEFLLVLSLWFTGFAILVPLAAWVLHTSPWIALVCAVLSAGGAYCSYLSAIGATAEYGDFLRSVFEMYRFDLLERLRIDAPKNLAQERSRWSELAAFIGRDHLLTLTYGSGAAAASDTSAALESPGGGAGQSQ